MKSLKSIVILLCLIISSRTMACECFDRKQVDQEYARVDVVFVGTVISVTEESHTLESVKSSRVHKVYNYQVKIEKRYKGELKSDTITIYSENGSCGAILLKDYKFTIYADRTPYLVNKYSEAKGLPVGENIYWTSYCYRTAPYNQNEIENLERLSKKK